MSRVGAFVGVLMAFLGLASCTLDATPPMERSSQSFSFTYATSPFADYLFYLLYHSTGSFPQLRSSVPLDGIAPFSDGIAPFSADSFLPQDAIISHVTTYSQLYKLAESHDNPEALKALLKRGEPSYPAFLAFWRTHIGLEEDQVIAAWQRQESDWPPVAHLEELERLKFPFSSIQVDVLALDPQGSSTQGPPTIFTTTQVPSLAWAVGHEGSHMMLEVNGANWTSRPGAKEAIQLIRAQGGSEYDVEVALCLPMQAKLSYAAGRTEADYRSSYAVSGNSPRKILLLTLERDWPHYLSDRKSNIADFLIRETIATFGTNP